MVQQIPLREIRKGTSMRACQIMTNETRPGFLCSALTLSLHTPSEMSSKVAITPTPYVWREQRYTLF